MTPEQLADQMEATFEDIERIATIYSGTVEAVAGGHVDEQDGIRIGSALLDFRDTARAALAKLAGLGPAEAHAALVWGTFRLQLARLEMDAGDLVYKFAAGQAVEPSEVTGFNQTIYASVLLRSELKGLREAAQAGLEAVRGLGR